MSESVSEPKYIKACGTCTLCCKLLSVKGPVVERGVSMELDKPSDRWCFLCKPGKGCTIYKGRPEACVTYECAWLHSQRRDVQHEREALPDDMRPDRCHVILDQTEDGTLIAHVDPGYPTAWKEGLAGRVINDAAQRQPVFIRTGGKRTLIGEPNAVRAYLAKTVGTARFKGEK